MDLKKINKKRLISIAVPVLIIILAGVGFYFYQAQKYIYTDQAEISAPVISLSAPSGGNLAELFVSVGDQVSANEVVARVGDYSVKTTSAGIITAADNNIGKNFQPGESVVSMVDPSALRLVAHLDENKGLKYITLGQRAVFTVDAYGSKKYVGVVDEVSEVSRSSAVVFSISDARQVKQFDVKIRFDISAYPELKNGMSAKVSIYKN